MDREIRGAGINLFRKKARHHIATSRSSERGAITRDQELAVNICRRALKDPLPIHSVKRSFGGSPRSVRQYDLTTGVPQIDP